MQKSAKCLKNGADCRDRTNDLMITNQHVTLKRKGNVRESLKNCPIYAKYLGLSVNRKEPNNGKDKL